MRTFRSRRKHHHPGGAPENGEGESRVDAEGEPHSADQRPVSQRRGRPLRVLPELRGAGAGRGGVHGGERAPRVPVRGVRGGDGHERQRGARRPHAQAARHRHPLLHAHLQPGPPGDLARREGGRVHEALPPALRRVRHGHHHRPRRRQAHHPRRAGRGGAAGIQGRGQRGGDAPGGAGGRGAGPLRARRGSGARASLLPARGRLRQARGQGGQRPLHHEVHVQPAHLLRQRPHASAGVSRRPHGGVSRRPRVGRSVCYSTTFKHRAASMWWPRSFADDPVWKGMDAPRKTFSEEEQGGGYGGMHVSGGRLASLLMTGRTCHYAPHPDVGV
mmetsp:Transcript_15979/g.34690  ORF Transcript_15979/g.34690 Transcript_15979/m.34690 type:complete len:331 (-) Transcript_15979:189-1181(-)